MLTNQYTQHKRHYNKFSRRSQRSEKKTVIRRVLCLTRKKRQKSIWGSVLNNFGPVINAAAKMLRLAHVNS